MNAVSYAVDEIITDLGYYSPLELLLRQGRIRYFDYESWRVQNSGTQRKLTSSASA